MCDAIVRLASCVSQNLREDDNKEQNNRGVVALGTPAVSFALQRHTVDHTSTSTMSDSFNFGASNGGGGGYDPNDFRASYPLPLPVTATRPLPPLPAHLQSHSRPPSPAEPVASTSASSTPNAAPSPVAGAAGEETPTSGKKRERGRQLGKESGGNSRKSSPAGLGGLLPVLEGVADDLAGKPTAVKRVKVGARASIACGTCR